MRATGPTVRRRNHAWLQMRSRERQSGQLARRQEQDDASDDGDVSDGNSDDDSVNSLDSLDSLDSPDSLDSLDSSDGEANPQPTQTLSPVIAGAKTRSSLAASLKVPPSVPASLGARARTRRWIQNLPRAEEAAGATLGVGEPGEGVDGVEGGEGGEEEIASESDGIESDGVESDEESVDETAAPPAITTSPAAGGAPPPPAITSAAETSTIKPPPPAADATSSSIRQTISTATSKRDSSNAPDPTGVPPQLAPIVAPSGSSSSSLDDLITSLTITSSQIPLTSATSSVAPTVPVTGATQSEEAQVELPPNSQPNEREGEGLGIGGAPSKLNSGAVAGIVLGVLALVGLLAGAALLWRKHRRDRGLPFFPQARLRLGDDDDGAHPGSVTGPLPGRVGGQNAAKTNTQIMDDLMKAAYATNNGENDMQGAYTPYKPQQQPTSGGGAFMDEKAYISLAGPPTPATAAPAPALMAMHAPAPELPPMPASPTPTAQKPVMRWLDEVRTPTQPNGPEIPPTPAMPQSATMPQPVMTMPSGGGRPLDPPRPAYYGRDTMTTDTTGTSVRWFG